MKSHLTPIRTNFFNLRILSASLAVCGTLIAGVDGKAQSPAPKDNAIEKSALPSYDVVSIRSVDPTGQGFQMAIMNPLHRARFQASTIAVRILMRLAYDVPEESIEGGPSWIDTELFSIDAKSDDAANTLLSKMTDKEAQIYKQGLLQQLLQERFHLIVHTETHEGTVTSLVLTDGGHKLQAASDAKNGSAAEARHSFGVQVGADSIAFRATPMRFLSQFLSQELHQRIVDQTGLSGTFDFDLHYHRTPRGGTDPTDSSTGPTIEDGLKQLGLKLQTSRGPVTKIVIQQISKPTPN